jgi:hypothetical protein
LVSIRILIQQFQINSEVVGRGAETSGGSAKHSWEGWVAAGRPAWGFATRSEAFGMHQGDLQSADQRGDLRPGQTHSECIRVICSQQTHVGICDPVRRIRDASGRVAASRPMWGFATRSDAVGMHQGEVQSAGQRGDLRPGQTHSGCVRASCRQQTNVGICDPVRRSRDASG